MTKTKKQTRLALKDELLADAQLAPRIPRYIGGNEVTSTPTLAHYGWVINVTDIKDERELVDKFPRLERILREKVKPGRDALRDTTSSRPPEKAMVGVPSAPPGFL